MANANITSTISHDLIEDVRLALRASYDIAVTNKVRRIGNNSYTTHAFSAYITAVASVEAFVNETFLGWMCRSHYAESALWQLSDSALKRMELSLKLVRISQLLFGHVLKRDAQPFQDFSMLIRVRNDLVHFKMSGPTPKYISVLSQRKIALVETPEEAGPWPWKLSCTEGIRWAHNAACNMVSHMVSLIHTENRDALAFHSGYFNPITETGAAHLLAIAAAKRAGTSQETPIK